ncbi:MAG: phosphate ABC transporter substrate-binding protein [Candidatus Eremiobacteraeota bacterium]|nr:phosphate ABC transporter substrate-binding protein [Candidatus Eremiobacteraeota bacterium]MBV9647854.1 phosphate ABC transporter substrate-binding protein [Candidatus Eremiobacteraeota bacterium]
MHKTAVAAALFLVGTSFVPRIASADTSITAAGSTALLPLVKAAADQYQSQHPDVKIAVSGGGSGTGINQVVQKAVDIGDSDIMAAGHPELVDHRVAAVGFALIAHPGVRVTNLTKKQIQDIFSEKVQNWKDVGGADVKITVINRPRNSGTRAVFTKTIMGDVSISSAGLTEDATGSVVTTVKSTPGAISYAAFSGTHNQQGIVELKIDGVAPTDENVQSGKYPVWSYEHMYTNGPPNAAISRFLAFVTSNSELLHKAGYILIRDMRVHESDR